MRYNYTFLFLFVGLLLINCENKAPKFVGGNRRIEIQDSVRAHAMVYFKKFGSNLKTNLKKQLALDSTGMKALTFCNIAAMSITEAMNNEIVNNFSPKPSPIKLRRTALKYRNPKNKPDDIDVDVMKTYHLSVNKKSVDVVETYDGYRVYRPLFIDKACLKCHGEATNIDPSVLASLKELYPLDEAIGYKLGDFRGVMVAEMKK